MFDSFVSYVLALRDEQLRELLLEDVALLLAWHENGGADATPTGATSGQSGIVVRTWLNEARAGNKDTEGRRQQPFLRRVIGKLQGHGADGLTRPEAVLLNAAVWLGENVSDQALAERILTLAAPHLDKARAVRGRIPGTARLAGIGGDLAVITPPELASAPQMRLRSLGGGDQAFRTRVLRCRESVRVVGSIDDDCTVVSEEGCCWVNGYVLGRLFARSGCDVRDNIGGEVVVRDGAIRARNVVDNSFVVSKMGDVLVRRSLSPRLLFGGASVCVREDAVMGQCVSPRITVAGRVLGGAYHTTVLARAERFETRDRRRCVVVLRQEISCEDYGERPDAQAARLMSRARSLEQRIEHIDYMRDVALREAERAGSAAFLYALGGRKEVISRLEMKRRADARLSMSNRVVAGIYTMMLEAEQRLAESGSSAENRQDGALGMGLRASFEEVDSELRELEDSGAAALKAGEKAALRGLQQSLWGTAGSERLYKGILAELRTHLERHIRERRELTAVADRLDRELGGPPGFETQPLETVAQRVGRLRDALLKMRRETDDEQMVPRIESSFFRTMVGTMGQRLDRVRELEEKREVVREELRTVTDRLVKDHPLVTPPSRSTRKAPAKVTGHFSPGVLVVNDPALADMETPPEDRTVETHESGDRPRTYFRGMDRVLEHIERPQQESP